VQYKGSSNEWAIVFNLQIIFSNVFISKAIDMCTKFVSSNKNK